MQRSARLERLERQYGPGATLPTGPYDKPPPSASWYAAFVAYATAHWADPGAAVRAVLAVEQDDGGPDAA